MLVQKRSEGSEPFRAKNGLWEVGQGVRYGKARKTDVGIPENRSQQIEKLFGLERKIVWRRIKNQSPDDF